MINREGKLREGKETCRSAERAAPKSFDCTPFRECSSTAKKQGSRPLVNSQQSIPAPSANERLVACETAEANKAPRPWFIGGWSGEVGSMNVERRDDKMTKAATEERIID